MLGRLIAKMMDSQDSPGDQGGQAFKYCPTCGDEFRSEFQRCAPCDCELVGDSNYAGRSPAGNGSSTALPVTPIEPGEPGLVDVSQGSLLDLKRVKNLLKGEGIASLIEGAGPDCLKSCCGGSKSFVIKVRKADIGAAGQILSRDFRNSTALDGHDLGPGAGAVFDERATSTCPACGVTFVPEDPVCPECGLCF